MNLSHLSFAIVTDSGADFTPEFQKKYDIHLVKTRIMINEVEFIDRENISREEIIKQMIEDKAKTSTSLAPRYEFVDTFEKLLEQYEKVLFIGISSKMSATYQSAYLMAKKVDREKIVVMDTKSVSWGMTFLIYHAALRREQGIPLEKVVEELKEMNESTKLFFMVNTLEYLRRGGRIGAAKSLIGSILGVKPVLTLNDGEIAPYDTVKKKEEGYEVFLKLAREAAAKYKNYLVVVLFGVEEEGFQGFKKRMQSELKPLEFREELIGANIISHTGPYLEGFGIIKVPENAVEAYTK